MLILAVRDLLHDPLRSFFSMLGMALVVVGALLLNALDGSLQDMLVLNPTSQNLLVIDATYIDPGDSNIPPAVRLAAEERIPGLFLRVSPTFFRQLRIGERVVQVRAAPREDFTSVHHLQLLEGRFPAARYEAVVGEGVASANGWKIGSRLGINGAEFMVTGIFRSAGISFSAIWLPIDAVTELFGADRSIQGLVLQISPGVDGEQARLALQADPRLAGGFNVFFEDTYTRRNTIIVRDMTLLMNVVSVIALLSICLGAFSASALVLSERTRQVGILRSVGFSTFSIRRFILFRALLLSGLGFCLALTGGWAYIAFHQAQGRISLLGIPLTLRLMPAQVYFYFFLTLGFAVLGAWIAMRRFFAIPVSDLLQD